MAQLKRGFVTWCENASRGFRRDLGLQLHEALDPRRLAALLGVQILRPGEIPGIPAKALTQLLQRDPGSWSAVTLIVRDTSLIIANNSHKITRQNSDLAHELSHLILKHEPSQMFVTGDGKMVMNNYNQLHEDEAGRLSSALLVPRDGLLYWLEKGLDDDEIANKFVISGQLLLMRKNLSGVARQMAHRGSIVS